MACGERCITRAGTCPGQEGFRKVDRAPDPRFEAEKYSYLYTKLGLITTDSEPENSLRYFKHAAEWKPTESFEMSQLLRKSAVTLKLPKRFTSSAPKTSSRHLIT